MRYLRLGALFLAGIACQWILSSHPFLSRSTPQALLILTVALGASAGPVLGETFGFLFGLYLDAMAPDLFGMNALLLTATGYAIGAVQRQIEISSPLPQGLLVAAVSWIYMAAAALVGLVFKGQAFWLGWAALFCAPALNGLLAPLGFSLVRRLARP